MSSKPGGQLSSSPLARGDFAIAATLENDKALTRNQQTMLIRKGNEQLKITRQAAVPQTHTQTNLCDIEADVLLFSTTSENSAEPQKAQVCAHGCDEAVKQLSRSSRKRRRRC
jgi:hypothetical protein